MAKLRIGVLGLANIARRSVIPAIKQLDDTYELVGVGTRDVLNAQSLDLTFSQELLVSYDSLLKFDGLDCVYIPLPTGLHHEWNLKFLSRGISVLSEKSLGVSLEEAREMVGVAENSNAALLENFQFQFHSQFSYLREILVSGRLGELRGFSAFFGFLLSQTLTTSGMIKRSAAGRFWTQVHIRPKCLSYYLGLNLKLLLRA